MDVENGSGLDYPPPLDQILTVGQDATVEELYNRIQPGPQHVPDLIRMALDEDLNWADGDSLEVWAPLQAARLLGKMSAVEAAEPLLPLLGIDDDWMREELPEIYGQFGAAAIPALEEYLRDPHHEETGRIVAAEGLQKIAEAQPTERDRVVKILCEQLQRGSRREKGLNGFLIAYLIDLKAEEALPDMERAFREDKVDLMVAGDWNDVRKRFSLEPTEEPFSSRREAWQELLAGFREAVIPRRPSSRKRSSSQPPGEPRHPRKRRAELLGKKRKKRW